VTPTPTRVVTTGGPTGGGGGGGGVSAGAGVCTPSGQYKAGEWEPVLVRRGNVNVLECTADEECRSEVHVPIVVQPANYAQLIANFYQRQKLSCDAKTTARKQAGPPRRSDCQCYFEVESSLAESKPTYGGTVPIAEVAQKSDGSSIALPEQPETEALEQPVQQELPSLENIQSAATKEIGIKPAPIIAALIVILITILVALYLRRHKTSNKAEAILKFLKKK